MIRICFPGSRWERALLSAALLLAGCLSMTLGAQGQKPVVITVHADQEAGAYRPIWNFFGADEPNYIEAAHGQKLLHE